MSRKRPRRRVFHGEIVGDILRARRGAHVREIDGEGNPAGDTFDGGRELIPNLGDQLVVAAVDLADDAIACVEVVAMDQDGTPRVRVLAGELPAGAVHIMPGRRARPPKRAVKRGPPAMPGAAIAEIVRRAREARAEAGR